VQSALLDVRSQLAPCAQMEAAAGDAHAGHAMPGMAPAASQAPPALQAPQAMRPVAPPAARTTNADPHAGHVMPGAAPSSAAGTAPARPAGVAPADPHAGMAMPAKPAGATAPPAAAGAIAATLASGRRPVTAIGELRCATTVDPKTAPRMLQGGRTYYFCSVEERAEFAKNPGRYVEAPPAGAPAAPAHAH